jgi:ubiquitin-protein ligase
MVTNGVYKNAILPFQITFTEAYPTEFPKVNFTIPVYHPAVSETNEIKIEKVFACYKKIEGNTNENYSKVLATLRLLMGVMYNKAYYKSKETAVRPEIITEMIENEPEFRKKVRECVRNSLTHVCSCQDAFFKELSKTANWSTQTITLGDMEPFPLNINNNKYAEIESILQHKEATASSIIAVAQERTADTPSI